MKGGYLRFYSSTVEIVLATSAITFFFWNLFIKKYATHTTAIKMVVDKISLALKRVNNHTIAAMAIKGINKPPGTLNVFSAASSFFVLNLIIAKITAR